jgi:hypothetical protein
MRAAPRLPRIVSLAAASLLSLSAPARAQNEHPPLAGTAALPETPAALPAIPPAPTRPAPPKNYFGASVTGVAGFLRLNIGSFEVFYERIVGRHHGLRLAGDFVHVHHNSDAVQSHHWTFGGTLAYRYHLGEGHGTFFGLKLGYRRGIGHYKAPPELEHIHLASEHYLALPQLGYRFFIPRAHLGLVTALGAGYYRNTVWATNRDDELGQLAARTVRDNLAATPVALDLELSISYAF